MARDDYTLASRMYVVWCRVGARSRSAKTNFEIQAKIPISLKASRKHLNAEKISYIVGVGEKVLHHQLSTLEFFAAFSLLQKHSFVVQQKQQKRASTTVPHSYRRHFFFVGYCLVRAFFVENVRHSLR